MNRKAAYLSIPIRYITWAFLFLSFRLCLIFPAKSRFIRIVATFLICAVLIFRPAQLWFNRNPISALDMKRVIFHPCFSNFQLLTRMSSSISLGCSKYAWRFQSKRVFGLGLNSELHYIAFTAIQKNNKNLWSCGSCMHCSCTHSRAALMSFIREIEDHTFPYCWLTLSTADASCRFFSLTRKFLRVIPQNREIDKFLNPFFYLSLPSCLPTYAISQRNKYWIDPHRVQIFWLLSETMNSRETLWTHIEYRDPHSFILFDEIKDQGGISLPGIEYLDDVGVLEQVLPRARRDGWKWENIGIDILRVFLHVSKVLLEKTDEKIK